jgi:uncharacterized protein (TIGR02996 family)
MAARKSAPATKKSLDALLAPVWAAPDDDDVKAVVGDALLEAGNPWGELIGLQLKIAATKASAADKKLALTLAKRHRDIVGGAIAKIGSTTNRWICEKGFLVECAVERRLVKRPDWEAAAKSPYWATVKRVKIGVLATPMWWMTEWAKNPATKNLRYIDLSNFHLERAGEDKPWRVTKATSTSKFYGKYIVAFVKGLSRAEQKAFELAPTIHAPKRRALEETLLAAGIER